jgi:hypothetical protein
LDWRAGAGFLTGAREFLLEQSRALVDGLLIRLHARRAHGACGPGVAVFERSGGVGEPSSR